MQITTEAVQRWIRVGLYGLFGALAQYGLTVPDSWATIIVSVVGFVATMAWTKYGSTLSAMLTEAEKTAGVQKIDVKVDPQVISPADLNAKTPDGVAAKAA